MAFVTKVTPPRKRTGYYYVDEDGNSKEIALHKTSGPPIKKPRHNGSWYPDEVKLEAATVFAVTRNVEKTAELTKVYPYVIRKWQQEAWWAEIISRVRKEKNEVLDAKITQVLDGVLDLITDRVENGEYIMDRKTKELHRLPMRAKDAAVVTEVLFDKRQLIRGEATSLTDKVSESDKLAQLQKNFERLAQSKGINPKGEIIDGKAEEAPSGDEAETLHDADQKEIIETHPLADPS